MSAPSVSAAASLYRTSLSYRSIGGRGGRAGEVALADDCVDECVRKCVAEGGDLPGQLLARECRVHCQQDCHGPDPCIGEQVCLFGPQRRCCPSSHTCCNGYEYPSYRQIINCCPPGTTCCNGKCCPTGQACCDGVCYTPTPGVECTIDGTCPADRVCEGRCCPPGEVCVGGRCCRPGPMCGDRRCCEGQTCPPGGGCCPADRTMTTGCCPEGQVACKVRTEGPSQGEPGGEGGGEPTIVIVEKCCPPGWLCVDETCCPPGECCKDNTHCAAQGKHCDKGVCCAYGQRAKFNAQSGKVECV
ncbi:hypothetical protein M5362_21065 [Streptomyces sp. Je 1-79]|uniref:hypothetical protein n=1 Tax=Streptomyces sp. Je 1-79 TaxID=2943847 RepID=UPI0021A479CD|nr:hypothetical protein [Streptomyces sp. Je 1-79]MCT4355631.1 hypothetical protein [Streptomyces sp. Je 1-79]